MPATSWSATAPTAPCGGRSPDATPRSSPRSRPTPAPTWSRSSPTPPDRAALDDMVAATKVVVSTVGPYAMYGSRAGRRRRSPPGTDYCDLTGETQWMRRMIDAHQDDAERQRCPDRAHLRLRLDPVGHGRVVHPAAGARAVRRTVRTDRRCGSMRCKGGASGGTIASMLNLMEEAAAGPGAAPDAGRPLRARTGRTCGTAPPQPDVTRPAHDPISGQWIAPFVMAAVNTRVVQRSHALLGSPVGPGLPLRRGHGHGRRSARRGQGRRAVRRAWLRAWAWPRSAPTRRLVDRVVPKPGDGPSPEAQRIRSLRPALPRHAPPTAARIRHPGDRRS